MTVGIAAICQSDVGPAVICASDRMITSGDIEFEPPQSKIYGLTTSIVMLLGGQTAAQIEIWQGTRTDIAARLAGDASWILVREAAEMVARRTIGFTTERQLRTVLQPIGLDFDSFVRRQNEMRGDFYDRIMREMEGCRPSVSTLVAGIDPTGPHIHEIDSWGDVVCHDAAGFAAIGAGQRHADSEFMFYRHAANTPFFETLYLTYAAKKRAEAAPGVGTAEDMFAFTGLGRGQAVAGEALRLLEQIYGEHRVEVQRANESAYHRLSEIVARAEEQIRPPEQQLTSTSGSQPEEPERPNGETESPVNPEAEQDPQSPTDGQ